MNTGQSSSSGKFKTYFSLVFGYILANRVLKVKYICKVFEYGMRWNLPELQTHAPKYFPDSLYHTRCNYIKRSEEQQ